jgi:hypothetical protein
MNKSALPTSLDAINAIAYAYNRVLKEKCNDPGIQTKYSVNGNIGIKWNSYPYEQAFTCPEGLEGCDKGHCDIVTEELCDKLSSPIYDELGRLIPKDKRTGESGIPLAFTDKNQCVFSNFMLQRYCEVPASRGYKLDDQGNITEVTNDPGVTDVPPFFYDKKNSLCYITPQYCKAMETDYEPGNPPTCEPTKAAEILGYFGIGNTLFKYLKRLFGDLNVKCDKVSKIVDDKAIKTKQLVYPDYGGKGVNLYLLQWKNDMVSSIPPNLGFIYSELKKSNKFKDNLAKDKDGYYYIDLSIDQVIEKEKGEEGTNYHKRIFYTYAKNDQLVTLLHEQTKKKSN